MSNPECNVLSFIPAATAGGKGQVMLRSTPDATGKVTNFTFPWSGDPPVTQTTINSLQVHEDSSIASAAAQIIAIVKQFGGGAGEGTATGDGGTTPTPTPTPGPTPTPTPVPTPPIITGMKDKIQVGRSGDVFEIADAFALLNQGGTVMVDDGVYLKAFNCDNVGVTVKSNSGNPGKCYMDGQGGNGGGHRMAWGKAMAHFVNPFTMIGIGGRHCGSPQSTKSYSNESFIYAESFTVKGKAHVVRCSADGGAAGFFVSSDVGAGIDWLDEECVMSYLYPNGLNSYAVFRDTGPMHDRYLAANTVEVVGAYSYGNVGHSVKSRSKDTYIHDCPLLCSDGGRAIEAPDGGRLRIVNNVIWSRSDRAPNALGLPDGTFNNSNLIAYGDESMANGVGEFTLNGNHLILGRGNSTIWVGAGALLTATNNSVEFFASGGLQVQGNATGISEGSATPNAPKTKDLPAPPAWFQPAPWV